MKNPCNSCSVLLKNPKSAECGVCMATDWKSKIKTLCGICQYPLVKSKRRYIKQGNLCPTCCAKAGFHAQYHIKTNIRLDDLDLIG